MADESEQKQLWLMETFSEGGLDLAAFSAFATQKTGSELQIEDQTLQQLQQLAQEFQHQSQGQPDAMDFDNNNEAAEDDMFNKKSDKFEPRPTLAEYDLVDDFQGFEETKIEDVPKVLEREWMNTTSTEEVKTEINFVQISVKITEHEIRKGAFLKNDFALFMILSEINDQFFARVHRIDEDFYELRKQLLTACPYLMIPPLPAKKTSIAPKKIEKRQRYYQRFLHAILKEEVLKSCQIFVDFVKLPERSDWLQAVKKAKENKVFNMVQSGGQMNVQRIEDNIDFAQKAKSFSEAYIKSNRNTINISKDIYKKSLILATAICSLSNEMNGFAKKNRRVDVPVQAKLFKKLSTVLHGHAVALRNTGELIKIYCGGGMKYYKQEYEPLIELDRFRRQQQEMVADQESALKSKKENLFKKDCALWESDVPLKELIGRSHQLRKDKNLAFPYICMQESNKLQEAKERLNFYTNQETTEIKRVGDNNGEPLVEHFVCQAQIQVEYIEQQKEIWNDFINYFTSGDPNMYDYDEDDEQEDLNDLKNSIVEGNAMADSKGNFSDIVGATNLHTSRPLSGQRATSPMNKITSTKLGQKPAQPAPKPAARGAPAPAARGAPAAGRGRGAPNPPKAPAGRVARGPPPPRGRGPPAARPAAARTQAPAPSLADVAMSDNPMNQSKRMARMSKLVNTNRESKIITKTQLTRQMTMAEQLEEAGKSLKPAIKPKPALGSKVGTNLDRRQTVMFLQEKMQAQLNQRKTIRPVDSDSDSDTSSDLSDD